MKKRLLAIFLCVAMVFSLGACGDSGKDNTESTEDTQAGTVKQPSVETLADYSDLSVIVTGNYEITEDILDVYFSEVLYGAGVGVKKVTDRDTVQAGDIVKTDYTGYVNGQAFENGAAENQWIDVSNNCGIDVSTGVASSGFIDGFSDGLIGAKVGEKASGDVIFPESYNRDTTLEDGSSVNLANQPATFEFVVHEIYEVVTPENITDAFVAENLSKSYEVNTAAEFMDFLEKELTYNYIINYLIENSEYNLPEEYLYARLESYQTYFEELYCADMGLENYLAQYGYTVDEMQVEWLSQVKNQIYAELIFAAILEKEGLSVDEAEHEAFIQKIMSANNGYFPDAESVYKYAGAGSAKEGVDYMKNQNAVRDYFIANYDK